MTSIPTSYSESTLTDRYQTTIPEAVRKSLGLNKRDKIRYLIQDDGQIVISRAEQIESDPILEKFLDFLAQDINDNPQQIQAIDSDLVIHLQSLVAGVDIDLNVRLVDIDSDE
jgi:antitoxin PrlF